MNLEVVKLGSLAKFVNGKAFKPSDWSDDGLPIIRIQNLNNKDKDFNYWNGSLDKQVIVENGNLLLAWSGTPGTSFGAHIWNGSRSVLNQHIFRVDVDSTRILKKYAKIAINAKLSKLIGLAHGGVGLQHVTKGMVEGLEIPLPPLEEQERIVALLGTADNVLRLREKAIAKLDELAKSVFVDMFGDVRASDKWNRRSIHSVASVYTGKTPPTADASNYADEVPFVTPTDLRGVITASARCVSKKGASLIKQVRAGSSLIGCIGDVGRVGFATMPVTFNQQINAVEWNEELVDDLYGYHALMYMEEVIKASAVSAVVPILNKTNFSNITIPVPPVTEQKKFAKLIRQLWRVKKEMGSSIEKKLIESLQHQSFAVN